ncbi:hypothetical protein [Amycolatopsis eburnea]|uniref:Uncharacterized protein n=1 Tax=Amycolatopsis eburnea TaxID=2267691 RepID=A0A3R9FBK5_9PSEU|nr:hypothetical protein [Amycolatopsis eburnea]RSD20894.1 hypothetical protein EIY87_12360 [Amycolatopsis eburnea]
MVRYDPAVRAPDGSIFLPIFRRVSPAISSCPEIPLPTLLIYLSPMPLLISIFGVVSIVALEQLKSILATLPPAEAEVIVLRFGLRDSIPRSRARCGRRRVGDLAAACRFTGRIVRGLLGSTASAHCLC